MSRILAASPITDAIKDLRHSKSDGFFGKDRKLGDAETAGGEPASNEDTVDLDALASASVEGGRRSTETEGWWHSA